MGFWRSESRPKPGPGLGSGRGKKFLLVRSVLAVREQKCSPDLNKEESPLLGSSWLWSRTGG